LNLLGAIVRANNDPAAALDLVTKAVRIDPRKAALHLNCGRAYSMLSQYETAIAHYDRAIAVNPESHAAPYHRPGAALQPLKRHEAVIASYEHALAPGSALDGAVYYGRAIARA